MVTSAPLIGNHEFVIAVAAKAGSKPFPDRNGRTMDLFHRAMWHEEDLLEIYPHDAEQRGVRGGDWVMLDSRAGGTILRALITDRVAPGTVYTTFHHPETAGASPRSRRSSRACRRRWTDW